MEKILIVDDVQINRMILTEILSEYETEEAQDGEQALELLRAHHDEYALVLLDLVMPKADGFDVLQEMREQGWISHLPVIVISGAEDQEAEDRSLKLQASDYIRKPFDARIVQKRVRNTVDLFAYKNSLESKVEEQTETLKAQNVLLSKQAKQLRTMNVQILDLLGTIVEYRDFESGEHVQRVKTYTRLLAEEAMHSYPAYGLTEELIGKIVDASAMHDLGKIAIPDNVLLKPGKLSDEEFELMKTHAAKGGEIIDSIRSAWEEEFGTICHDICRYHHEKYDGRGYPDRLKGEEIPLAAQLVSIADVYDALVTDRVYKKAFAPDEALRMIRDGECGVFSPRLLDCLGKVREAFIAAANQK